MRRLTPRKLGLPASRFRSRDLIREAFLSIAGHPTRSLLTAIGTVLGAAAFVATLGLSSTLSHQVASSFDVRRATEVTITVPEQPPGAPEADPTVPGWQTPASVARLRGLNGVEAAGARLILGERTVGRTVDPASDQTRAAVIGMDSGAFGAIKPHIIMGRTYDAFHDRTAAPVVLVPGSLARELGITRVGVAVFIDDRPYTVIGVFDDVVRRPETLLAVLMPYMASQPLAGHNADTKRDVVVKTAPGAAQLIGSQASLALSPQNPSVLKVIAPPDPKTLRRELEGDVTRLSLALSIVALAIGAVSIGNAATAGITARVSEVGLRRALGAKRSHVFAQLLGETTLLGALGGLLGALLGVVITVAVALFNSWQPIIDLQTAGLALAGGALAGLLAGLLPAYRAMRIQPVAALQR